MTDEKFFNNHQGYVMLEKALRSISGDSDSRSTFDADALEINPLSGILGGWGSLRQEYASQLTDWHETFRQLDQDDGALGIDQLASFYDAVQTAIKQTARLS